MKGNPATLVDIPTLVDIIRALSITYTESGVVIWLGAWNTNLDGRPIDLCRTSEGKSRVAQEAYRVAS